MQPSRWERYAPLAGVLFVALFVASFIVFPDTVPDTDESVAEVVEFWKDNKDAAIISSFMFVYAIVAFMWFLASLRSALRSVEPTGRLSALVLAGGAIFAGGGSVSVGLQFAAAESVEDVPDTVTQTLSVLTTDIFFQFQIGAALIMLPTAVVVLRHGGLPKWLGWAALVLGVALLTPIGFFAFLVVAIWVLVVSVVLFRATPAAASSQAAAT